MPTDELVRSAGEVGRCDHTWVTVDDLADELQIPKSTIYGWKCRGLGPTWTRVGKHLRARRVHVDAWLDSLNADNSEAAAEATATASSEHVTHTA
ncbi:helix-turn-helix domain-containing protein [Streptomyces sp. NBC_00354]|uniref:helix-turn-helix domain-containing protein n=1 Tax=Streptomyces sp. NBC_00354 TaxID=2975723 RepID=UPI002E270543